MERSFRSTALCALLLVASSAGVLRAADHLDAPALSGMGDVDINDLYVFQSPSNPDNTVMILTVNPFAGAVSGTSFSSDARYEFSIDNDGDAVADVTYTTTFGALSGGSQSLMTSRTSGGTTAPYASGSTEMDIATPGLGTIRAGLFDDPFFFDLTGFQNGLNFTGEDAFAGANVSAIVLEAPSSELGGPNIGVWARTVSGTGDQIDRMGRPAINTVLIPSGRKDEFNQADPADDFADFGADVQATIEALNGGDVSHASTLTSILLADVLTFDTTSNAGFLNGRQLADDVIDAELTLLTNSASPIGDGVDMNDVPFRNVFPYLAAPNVVPEPAGLLLAATALVLSSSRRRTRCF